MRRLAAAASAVAALTCVSAFPAQAVQAEHVPPFTPGMVFAHHRGVIRSGPSTSYTVSGHVRDGQIVPLLCETTGQSVRGNRLWYKLNDRPEMWVSSVLVGRMGKAPAWCVYRGAAAHPLRHHAKMKLRLHGATKNSNRLLTHQVSQLPHVPQSMENQRLSQQELRRLQRELLREQNQHAAQKPNQPLNQRMNEQELPKLQRELTIQQNMRKPQMLSARPAQVGKD